MSRAPLTETPRLDLTSNQAFPRWLWPGLAAILLLRLLLALGVPAPIIFSDEQVYLKLAQSFADGTPFLFRGVSLNLPTFLYALVIAPTQWVADPQLGYHLVQALNAALLALAGVAIALVARPLIGAPFAAGVALVASLAPTMLYANLAMTESLFLLEVVAIFHLAARAFGERSLGMRLGLGLMLGLAFLTKPHGMLLPGVVLGGLAVALLHKGDDHPLVRLRRFWPVGVVYAGFLLAHLVKANWLVGSSNLLDPAQFFGTYQEGLGAIRPFDLGDFALALISLLGAATFGSGVLPVLFFLFFAAYAWRRGTREERVFAAMASLLALALGVLTARHNVSQDFTVRVFERYTFYLMPLAAIGAVRAAQVLRPPLAAVVPLAAAFLAGAAGLGYLAAKTTPLAIETYSYATLWRPALTLGWESALGLGAAATLAFVLTAAAALRRQRWRLVFGLFLAHAGALTLLAWLPQSSLSRMYAAHLPYARWIASEAAPRLPVAFVSDGLPGIPLRLAEVQVRQPVRMYYLDRRFDGWHDRRIAAGADGTVAELSALPDGATIVTSDQVRLDQAVIARRGKTVLYRKAGAVRLRVAGDNPGLGG